ncbi:Hpt domain-containing protein [Acerihabitans sp. KWT182]|uniref:Hpt domain-containing protein n=1 Tax=Acerihabitans sp. KWT182 TaxID=3157919 RepID=A0AAU7QFG6_9GAMM
MQAHDVLVTDDESRLEDFSLLVQNREGGITLLTPNRLQVNFNLASSLLDAMLQLMELRLAQSDVVQDEGIASAGAVADSPAVLLDEYLPLFVETVPDDIKRLYTEAESGDLAALAQTAHRLKGVFAMLNLLPGKLLCETLEQHIKQAKIENDNSKIGDDIRQIDVFVIKLLQHAR